MQKLTTAFPVSLEDAYILQAFPLRWEESEIGAFTVTGIFYSEYGGYELTLAEPLPPDHEPDTYVATVGDDVALFHTPQSLWWALTEQQREHLERAVDHIIQTLCWSNRQTVIELIREAYRRGLDKTPLQSAVLWLLREKVDQDD